jgi:phospholipase D-like protein
MSAVNKWSELSHGTRRLLLAAAAVEGGLKTAALVDIKRRRAREIRGPKWAWVVAVVAVNGFGAAPLSYFAFGRRR